MKSSVAVTAASKLLDEERLIEMSGKFCSAESNLLSYRGIVNTEAAPKGQYMLPTGDPLPWTSVVNLRHTDNRRLEVVAVCQRFRLLYAIRYYD